MYALLVPHARLACLLGDLAPWWVLILSPLPAWPQLSATVWRSLASPHPSLGRTQAPSSPEATPA